MEMHRDVAYILNVYKHSRVAASQGATVAGQGDIKILERMISPRIIRGECYFEFAFF